MQASLPGGPAGQLQCHKRMDGLDLGQGFPSLSVRLLILGCTAGVILPGGYLFATTRLFDTGRQVPLINDCLMRRRVLLVTRPGGPASGWGRSRGDDEADRVALLGGESLDPAGDLLEGQYLADRPGHVQPARADQPDELLEVFLLSAPVPEQGVLVEAEPHAGPNHRLWGRGRRTGRCCTPSRASARRRDQAQEP